MIQFTQGDNAILNLTATDGAGNPINLTGATFSTQILGANNLGTVTFPNSQHAIVSAPAGTFTLTLSQADTLSCGLGDSKDVLTQVTISGAVTHFRGRAILSVAPAVPLA